MSETKVVEPYQGKVSVPFLQVISFFLENSGKEFSGYEVFKTCSLQSGTIYPLLGRLLENGWLTAEWEENNPLRGKKPRLLYKLTVGGYNEAMKQLGEYISPNIQKCFNPMGT